MCGEHYPVTCYRPLPIQTHSHSTFKCCKLFNHFVIQFLHVNNNSFLSIYREVTNWTENLSVRCFENIFVITLSLLVHYEWKEEEWLISNRYYTLLGSVLMMHNAEKGGSSYLAWRHQRSRDDLSILVFQPKSRPFISWKRQNFGNDDLERKMNANFRFSVNSTDDCFSSFVIFKIYLLIISNVWRKTI